MIENSPIHRLPRVLLANVLARSVSSRSRKSPFFGSGLQEDISLNSIKELQNAAKVEETGKSQAFPPGLSAEAPVNRRSCQSTESESLTRRLAPLAVRERSAEAETRREFSTTSSNTTYSLWQDPDLEDNL